VDNLPYAMILAGRATRRVAHSALPDAPVVAEPASAGGHDGARAGGVRARRGGACVPTS
jgi:hypothetical protein